MVSIWATWHVISIIIQHYIFYTYNWIDMKEICHPMQVQGPGFDCVISIKNFTSWKRAVLSLSQFVAIETESERSQYVVQVHKVIDRNRRRNVPSAMGIPFAGMTSAIDLRSDIFLGVLRAFAVSERQVYKGREQPQPVQSLELRADYPLVFSLSFKLIYRASLRATRSASLKDAFSNWIWQSKHP